MNSKILKDVKVKWGFISAIVLGIIAVALAVYNIGYWVVIVILSVIISSFSVYRADQLYKTEDKDN
ncbi:damage-inducible protein DinB [Bacillus cereus]|nr:damage-inducible protein DinB [Bacillus cereus]